MALKFDDPQALAEKIDDYFKELAPDPQDPKDEGRPPTMSGLALFLGTTRKTLCDYINAANKPDEKQSRKKKACGDLLIMAKAQIECWLEERLVTSYSKGLEFVLQNGYDGWGTKASVTVEAEASIEHKGEVKIAELSDEELLNRIGVLSAKAEQIRAKEGAASADS